VIPRFQLALAAMVAVITAALAFWSLPAYAQYYGDAPWCAVVGATDGEMVWHCYYRSVEECQPHVIAGDRGFCNVNPYGSHPDAAQQTPPRHRKHSGAS
jgi:hypothetical protein